MKRFGERRVSVAIQGTYYTLLIALTAASLITTHQGAQFLLGDDADRVRAIGAWVLAGGIQLVIVFGSLIVSMAIRASSGRLIASTSLATAGTVIALAGIFMSAVTSYVCYHQIVNNEHLQAVANAGIEWLERDYRIKYERYVRDAKGHIVLSLDQAQKEFKHWSLEFLLQDSNSSPNRTGKGPRYDFARQQAEAMADFIERHTGERPVAKDQDVATSGTRQVVRSPIAEILAAFDRMPERLSIYPSVAKIRHPLERYLAAYRIYRQSVDEVAAVYVKMPPASVLELPKQHHAFDGHDFGDRVTIEIDGHAVSNIPVPGKRAALPPLMTEPPRTPASYEALKQSVQEFRVAAGRDENEARTLAGDQILSLGEHPWLVAASQLMHPDVVVWLTVIPATLVDMIVLLASIVFGYMTAYVRNAPIHTVQRARDFSDEIQKYLTTLEENFAMSDSIKGGPVK